MSASNKPAAPADKKPADGKKEDAKKPEEELVSKFLI